MPVILILTLTAIILFMLGIACIFRAYQSVPDGEKSVPSTELESLSGKLRAAEKSESDLKLQLDAVSVQLEETRGKLEKSISADTLKAKERQYEGEIKKLKRNIHFISEKADTQAQNAIEALNKLQDNNTALKQEAEESTGGISQEDLDSLKAEKDKLEEAARENGERIKELESELEAARSRSETVSPEAQSTITSLTEENRKLKDAIHEITGKIDEVEDGFQKMKEAELKARSAYQAKEDELASAQKNIEAMEKDMAALKTQIDSNQSSITQLEGQVQPSAVKTNSSSGELSLLTESGQNNDLLARLKDENALLKEKETILKDELTKTRTQALGLEKICEDFKNQIEKK